MKTTFKELMEKYTEYRTKWIEQFGTDKGFDSWFTQQVGIKGGL